MKGNTLNFSKKCLDGGGHYKTSLYDEVRFNYEQTKNKIDILNQAISALKSQKFLSTKCSKYSTIEFENLYHIALPNLSIVERDNLRHLHGFYVTIDKLLDRFDETLKNDIDNSQTRKNTIEYVYTASVTKLEDIKNSLIKSLNLSSGLIKNEPISIFPEKKA